jgi:SAM-dependent methyltransferase
VDALVEDVGATVRSKRAAGEYPQALLDDLSRDFDIAAAGDPPEVLSLIQTARPLRGSKPVVTVKKIMRRLLAWYVRPIAEDQTRFNDAISRELRSLERRVQAVESSYQPAPGAHLANPDSRAVALKESLPHSTGQVLIIGAADSQTEIAAQAVVFDVAKPRIGDRLNRLASDTFAAVVLDGVLQRVSGQEISALLRTALRVLKPAGLVLVLGPDPSDPNCPQDPSEVDLSMRRWLTLDTVVALLDATGFAAESHTTIDSDPRWYLAVATRPE